MPLNPTLKNVLVRTAYIVGSLLACLILFIGSPTEEHHKTLTGIWQFAVALAVIWFNIRKLAKPIQLITIGSYLLVFAGLMCWYKIEALPTLFDFIPDDCGFFTQQSNYRIWRIFCCIGFILLASMLSIFLKSVEMPKLKRFGKIWIWTAILTLDFVAAMPNIYFTEDNSYRLYEGTLRAERHGVAIYAFANGDHFVVFLPQDSIHLSGNYRQTYYIRHGNLLIQPDVQDTILLKKGGVTPHESPTLECRTSCLIRWQWQYYAWHKIKGLFCKDKNEQ